MHNLALKLQGQGRWGDAEVILRERLRSLEIHNPRVVPIVDMLATPLNEQCRYEEAGDLGAHALKLCEAELGFQHPDTVRSFKTLANTASSLKRLGNYEKCLTISLTLHSLSEKICWSDHRTAFHRMGLVPYILDQVGRYNEILAIFKNIYDAYQIIYGQDHEQTLEAMLTIAKLLAKLEKWEQAMELSNRVCTAFDTVFGPEDQGTLSHMIFKPIILCQLKRYDESLAIMDRLCASSQRALGADHPLTKACCERHALVLEEENNNEWSYGVWN